MLDDFREWLSDYLRYFMLGGAILLVLLIVIFGVRACSKSGTKKQNEETQTQKEETKTDQEETNISPSATNEEEKQDEEAPEMEKADGDITALIEDYYQALGNKDIDKLRMLVEDLSPSDESKITNSSDYIEKYEVDSVYMKEGLDENSYVIYAVYNYYCQGIDAAVPALSQFYIHKKADGDIVIDGTAETDSAISAYTDTLQNSAEVKALSRDVQSRNKAALEENPELQAFLQGLGEDDTDVKTESGPIMIANDICNVRDNPGGDIIGGIDEGTRVEKLGEEDGWIKIDYEGQTGYVYGELLDEAE